VNIFQLMLCFIFSSYWNPKLLYFDCLYLSMEKQILQLLAQVFFLKLVKSILFVSADISLNEKLQNNFLFNLGEMKSG